MTRRIYIWLLWLHPAIFRQRFGDEMLAIFDQSADKTALLADGLLSLARQRARRKPALAFTSTTAADGVPLFYSAAPEVPRPGPFFFASLVTVIAFSLICFTMSHRGGRRASWSDPIIPAFRICWAPLPTHRLLPIYRRK